MSCVCYCHGDYGRAPTQCDHCVVVEQVLESGSVTYTVTVEGTDDSQAGPTPLT